MRDGGQSPWRGIRETVAPQGRGARAYRDVFTACLPEASARRLLSAARRLP